MIESIDYFFSKKHEIVIYESVKSINLCLKYKRSFVFYLSPCIKVRCLIKLRRKMTLRIIKKNKTFLLQLKCIYSLNIFFLLIKSSFKKICYSLSRNIYSRDKYRTHFGSKPNIF